MNDQPTYELSINSQAASLFDVLSDIKDEIGCETQEIEGARILDAGVHTHGSVAAGLGLAGLCMGDLANIEIQPADPDRYATTNAVYVQTDHPLHACLGAQYAGWPVQSDDFFAMGSGPMRLARGREEMLGELELTETGSPVVGVLESDSLPTASAIKLIAEQCQVETSELRIAVAPTSTIAGSLQVVARSIETALHKLHELKFDVRTIISATGHAPLPPPAKPGDMASGIGRTNDAMLYGATVTLWVDADDEAIEAVASQVPSETSKDHGRPFKDVFKDYGYDFYKVDPMLFSPAVVMIHSLRTGRSWHHGKLYSDVLRQSFFG
ncbi:Methenyltetrahydromethanopterin cyclohydrolase [Rubripirellula amarantea]|uniref:Methenyltetrahydromethanopterin cyclohydrolase n=1 Tax=Rubripirellula amarantea TaxID=2527999 RepID=A0A5C5WDV2_9BACT|nr:methenyltetrahydromethanopterin cyclohydrolase [Rubripirellula amarantea]TWT49136.1 Methenyltetrahydromethanopterin cyclohydrolase [Rubripirellula amarantea]